jgi:hypothetical protein
MTFLSEHFCTERLNLRTHFPRIGRKAGFAAGLFEKGGAVPMMLNRHLRQKQAAASAQAD